MEEEYILRDTAQLAKSKGFNEWCDAWYCNSNLEIRGRGDIINERMTNTKLESLSGLDEEYVTAPSQSLLAKWLREAHNMFIYIDMRKYTARYKDGKVNIYALYYYKIVNNINTEVIVESTNMEDSFSYETVYELGLQKALTLIE